MKYPILLVFAFFSLSTAQALVANHEAIREVVLHKPPKPIASRIALEKRLGEPLTSEQTRSLRQLIQADSQAKLIQVSEDDTSTTIYCVGARAALAWSRVEAVCLNIWTGQTYGVSFFGFGPALQLTVSAFRLVVSYDSERYDANFDAIPGDYYAMIAGATVGFGKSNLEGSSGNKKISGQGVNQGFGAELSFAGWLHIE